MTIREAFEAWIQASPIERRLTILGEGSPWAGQYRDSYIEISWAAWQASAALAEQRIRESEDTERDGD